MKVLHLLILGLFISFTSTIYAQTPNNCNGAIKVCGDGIISSNTVGFGVQELNNSNNCNSIENNSLWLEVKIKTGGTLGFTLKPTSNSLEIDYDFFVFGPNVTCGNIGQAIRCSTTNPIAAGLSSNETGMNESNGDTSEGPGASGNSFVRSLDVLPNETYYIVLDRPIGASAFELEWNGTATFFEPPIAFQGTTLVAPDSSGSTSLFNLSENDSHIINGQTDVSIAYYDSLSDAIAQLNPLPIPYEGTDEQTIYARVTKLNDFGCFDISEFKLKIGITIIIPQFFTPNNDGYHDVWNIPEQPFITVKNIKIFDRYGKLLKDIVDNSKGWDGTYNGQALPSADYWYVLTYYESDLLKERKGHFALKR